VGGVKSKKRSLAIPNQQKHHHKLFDALACSLKEPAKTMFFREKKPNK
jgi:hypothetical protein